MTHDASSAPPRRTRVKVCGITTIEDALLTARFGADMIGLNFYPPSPRAIGLAQARRIVAALDQWAAGTRRPRPTLVAVVVDEPAERIERLLAAGLDLVQMHGDEEPAAVRRFGRRALKALRVEERFDPALATAFLDQRHGGASPWGFLIDAKHPRLYGGSGRSWSVGSLAGTRLDRPVLIAGGLEPSNVRAAAAASGAWGVDVCSGVESSPGIKDPSRLARFIEEICDGTCAAAS